MSRIEAVIFDIGNVLIEWQPEQYYDRTIGEERRKQMFDEVDLHAMNELVDLGHNFTDTVYGCAERNPKWRDEIRTWHDKWIELAQPAINHSVHLQRALRAKGVPVFSLTNFGIETHDYAETFYPFLNEFDRRYISGHMKVTKPDAQIFQMVEDDCGIDPASLLFTDDRPDNINAAAKRGWQTHLFDGPQAWAARLIDEGLLTTQEATPT